MMADTRDLWAAALLAALCLLLMTAWEGAAAQEAAGPAPAEEAPDAVRVTEDAIETTADPADDARITARLSQIYGQIERLSGVEPRAAGGVVTLEGLVPDADATRTAEIIAARTSGVVAVENALEEDVSAKGALSPAAERAERLGRQSVALLPLLAVAAAIVVGFWFLGLLLGRQKWLWRRVGRNELIAGLLATAVPVIVTLLGLVTALAVIDAVAILSAVLGAAGVLGLAVGFAIKDGIENFVASILLSLRQPFRAKDFVEIDGRQGVVVRLTSRATILMTPDGNHLRIPNAQVFKSVMTNFTRNPERRFTFVLGIDAEDDPKAAAERGMEALVALPFVLKEPAPLAWIEEVGESNIVLTFAPWIDQRQTDFLKARSAAIRAVKMALEQSGFTLPEPIYRLRVDQVPQGLTLREDGATAGRKPPVRDASPAAEQDTAPDQALGRIVEEDRRQEQETDLLSSRAPSELGPDGSR